MAEEKGKLLTCDRCGRSICLKYIGKGEVYDSRHSNDYWDKFEPMPDTWLYETAIGYLCDDCAYLFRQWVTEFTYGRVSPIWNVNRHKDYAYYEQKDCDIKCE